MQCDIGRSRSFASQASGTVAGPSENVVFGRWKEAIADLEQFIDRYPTAPEVREARYMLAKAWQRSAEGFEQSLKSAETENARTEFRRQKIQQLELAITEFNRLQIELRDDLEADRLNELGQTLLRNCSFEVAHTYYALGRFDDAIDAYSSAATRYQLQAETLTAYVQMANCYEQMGKRAEARSMLEQAKVIVNQIPDTAFQSPGTTLTRDEWRTWLNWAMGLNS
jgi:tetratricopeptide (TPR) repeat protein